METCKKGHPKTEENWVLRKVRTRWEYRCRECNRESNRRYSERVREGQSVTMEIELSVEQKKEQYTDAIVRLHEMGLWSTEGAQEALERVGNLT